MKTLFLIILSLVLAMPGSAQDVRYGLRKVRVGKRTVACKVVTLDLNSGRLAPRLVIAQGGIGRTESFAAMVKRTKAVAAINGSFFDAYNAGIEKDPVMTLICNGQTLHRGSIGTVLGFGPVGPLMGRLNLPIRGTVKTEEGTEEWVAYALNRTPTIPHSATIFTPARGKRTRVAGGVSVIVDNEEVREVTRGNVLIPPTGFVLNFRGAAARQAEKFYPGAKVGYSVGIECETESEAWRAVSEAVGAGPRLLTDGFVTCDPYGEGFSDPRVTRNTAPRSAVGITKSGKILLVTVPGVTVHQLARVMQKLRAYQAMNFDGGSSSGLYVRGKMLTRPGRPLSNILVFTRS